jgi:hypothetical protein
MVTIEGFYDDTWPISDADRTAIDALPDVEERLQEELGFGGPEVSSGVYPDRLMIPSFNVRGLSAAAVGEDGRNVVPAERPCWTASKHTYRPGVMSSSTVSRHLLRGGCIGVLPG